MIKRIQDMSINEIQNIDLLDLDDTIPFDCKVCGSCCKDRHDLILTPYDVFRLARYLTRTTEEIIRNYCEVYERRNSHLPVVRVLPRPPEACCPFLRNRKCAVHPAKPILCRVFPLAKVVKCVGSKPGYYFNEMPSCKHGDGPVTIREWVGNAASEESDRAATGWVDSVFYITPLLENINLNLNQRSRIFKAMFTYWYLMYNVKLEFTPQLKDNTDSLYTYMLNEFGIEESGVK